MRLAILLRAAALLGAAALSAQTRDVPVHGANLLRIDGKTVLSLGENRIELRRGKLTYRIVDSGAPPVEIVTPIVTVHPYLAGDYRIEVKSSGESIITPLGGEVKVSAPQGAEWVPVGKKMIARGPAANPQFKITTAHTGWRWIAAAMQSASQGGGVQVGAGAGNDDSPPPSRGPSGPPPSAPASSVGRGASAGETRSGSIPSRGK